MGFSTISRPSHVCANAIVVLRSRRLTIVLYYTQRRLAALITTIGRLQKFVDAAASRNIMNRDMKRKKVEKERLSRAAAEATTAHANEGALKPDRGQ